MRKRLQIKLYSCNNHKKDLNSQKSTLIKTKLSFKTENTLSSGVQTWIMCKDKSLLSCYLLSSLTLIVVLVCEYKAAVFAALTHTYLQFVSVFVRELLSV